MSEGCASCARAEKNPKTGRFTAGCLSCDGRALAQTQEAKDAMLGHPQALQAVLRRLYPSPDKYRAARVAAYEWIKRLS